MEYRQDMHLEKISIYAKDYIQFELHTTGTQMYIHTQTHPSTNNHTSVHVMLTRVHEVITR